MATYQFPVVSTDLYEVVKIKPGSVRHLDRFDKATQLARANGATVVARVDAVWSADRTIAIHGTGSVEIATYMHNEDMFDSFQGTTTRIAANQGAFEDSDMPLVFNTDDPTKFVKFVQFDNAVQCTVGHLKGLL